MSRDRERFEEIGKKIKKEAYESSQMGKRHVVVLSGNLNTITPCAACKLLRRRCAEECPFYPYFSPHEPQKFAAVHKVFGASNVSKMLTEVPESQRADTANSLVFEANLRLRDTVYGCVGAISALQQQIQALQAELSAVRAEILEHKYREATSNLMPSTQFAIISPGAVSIAAPSPPSLPSVQLLPPPLPLPPPLSPHSIVVSSSSSSSASSLYTSTTSTTGYREAASNLVPSTQVAIISPVAVSIAAPSPPALPSIQLLPPPPPPPSHSIVVSSSSSSSASSLYTSTTSTKGFSSISSDNISIF